MTSMRRFDVQAEMIGWMINMIRKHLPLDERDIKEFDGIIRDARFYETVLHLQLEEEEESDNTTLPPGQRS